MKKIITTFLTIFISNIINIYPVLSHQEPPINNWERSIKNEERLKIKLLGIKSQTVFKINPKTNERDKVLYSEFDKEGNLITQTVYENGNIKDKDIFKYNIYNEMIEQSAFDGQEKAIYKYNNEGLIDEYIYYKNDQIKARFKYIRDKNLIELKKYNPDNIEYTINYYFEPNNIDGKLISATKYNFDNTKQLEVSYTYNDKGKKSKKIVKDYQKALNYQFNYTYDSKGNLIEVVKSDSNNNNKLKYVYTYNKKNNIDKELEYKNEELINIYEYSYVYYENLFKVEVIDITNDQSMRVFKGNNLCSGLVVLKPNESVGSHNTNAYEEILVILEGEGIFLAEDNSQIPITKGKVLYCPPYTEHNVKNTGNGILKYIYIVTQL